MACSESGYTDDTEDLKHEQDGNRVCCCDAVSGVKIIVTLFAVINLGIIATGPGRLLE